MVHLHGFVLLTVFLRSAAYRSIHIRDSNHDTRQQTNTLIHALEESAEAESLAEANKFHIEVSAKTKLLPLKSLAKPRLPLSRKETPSANRPNSGAHPEHGMRSGRQPAPMEVGSGTTIFRTRSRPPIMRLPSWVPAEIVEQISEPAAQAAFESMHTVELELPSSVASGPCTVRYLKTNVEPKPEQPPVLLVHGFDTSCLEYRRLLPELEAAGIEAYAPCVAGWGFTETTALRTVGIEAKRAQLLAFHQVVLGGRPAVWVGASLGACMVLDCYLTRPAAVHAIATIAPGFFTSPPPAVPAPFGRLLVKVLSAPSVREFIAKQAYSVKEAQTDDAMECGNLHLNRAKWEEDSLEWLSSGAYGDQAPLVEQLRPLSVLTLWGRQDEVIPPVQVGSWPAGRLVQALPEGTFRWVERSGHTPQLEQPRFTAEALAAFVRGQPIEGDGGTAGVEAAAARWDAAKEAAAKLGAAAREKLGEALRKLEGVHSSVREGRWGGRDPGPGGEVRRSGGDIRSQAR